jgi:hypothetical protein
MTGNPFMLAVVSSDDRVLDQLFAGPEVDTFTFVQRFTEDGGWWLSTFMPDLAQGEAWGLPVVWGHEVIASNCDRLVRCCLRRSTLGWDDHHPVRRYDLSDVAHHAKDWARIMGAELVYTDREGGPGLTNAARLQLVGSEEA